MSSLEGSLPYRDTDDEPPIFTTSVSGGDIAIWVARMTGAMTSALQSGPNRQLMEGMNRDVVIFVQVDWLWHGLPLVVKVGSAILLAFVIWQSKSRHGGMSPVPSSPKRCGDAVSLYSDPVMVATL